MPRCGHHAYVERARNGILFLDEVGELPMLMQVKLLRLIQKRAFTRVGRETAIKSGARFTAISKALRRKPNRFCSSIPGRQRAGAAQPRREGGGNVTGAADRCGGTFSIRGGAWRQRSGRRSRLWGFLAPTPVMPERPKPRSGGAAAHVEVMADPPPTPWRGEPFYRARRGPPPTSVVGHSVQLFQLYSDARCGNKS